MPLLILHLEYHIQFEASPCCWMGAILEKMHRSVWESSFIHSLEKYNNKEWWERDKIQNCKWACENGVIFKGNKIRHN